MPEFVNPFTGVVPGRKMTDTELLRALRLDLSAEEEAVHLYLSHADATDNELAKQVLQDVANEERVHKGEFQRLISILSKGMLSRRGACVSTTWRGRPADQAMKPRIHATTIRPSAPEKSIVANYDEGFRSGNP
jgi:Mn-containing catalase